MRQEEDRNRSMRIERRQQLEKSWELAKLCREYKRENGRKWEGEMQDRRKRREKDLAKEERKNLAREKKENTLKKLVQKKIETSKENLNEADKKKMLELEEKKRRLELKETKENLWKWREKKP